MIKSSVDKTALLFVIVSSQNLDLPEALITANIPEMHLLVFLAIENYRLGKMDNSIVHKKIFYFITALFIVCLTLLREVHAQEKAEFRIQASESMDDGTVRISVYLNGTSVLGGIDAEMIYNPEKVEYVSSGIGNSFTDGFGMTNCDKDSSTIKCVALFSGSKEAKGELMYAIFKPNGDESYQPEFRVVDLVDSSVEIMPIPYTIFYQQSNGEWSDSPDFSGEAVEQSSIEQAREQYGAENDKNERQDIEGNGTAVNKISKLTGESDNTVFADDNNANDEKTGSDKDDGETRIIGKQEAKGKERELNKAGDQSNGETSSREEKNREEQAISTAVNKVPEQKTDDENVIMWGIVTFLATVLIVSMTIALYRRKK